MPAIQTQHPGIYYHKAAEYIGKRKEAYLECIANNTNAPAVGMYQANISSSVFCSDFFGVRNTKVGDSNTENQIFVMVQANEKFYNHSVNAFSFLA